MIALLSDLVKSTMKISGVRFALHTIWWPRSIDSFIRLIIPKELEKIRRSYKWRFTISYVSPRLRHPRHSLASLLDIALAMTGVALKTTDRRGKTRSLKIRTVDWPIICASTGMMSCMWCPVDQSRMPRALFDKLYSSFRICTGLSLTHFRSSPTISILLDI